MPAAENAPQLLPMLMNWKFPENPKRNHSYTLCFAEYFASGVRSALRINEERKKSAPLGRHSLARHGDPRKKAALCASQSNGRHNVAASYQNGVSKRR